MKSIESSSIFSQVSTKEQEISKALKFMREAVHGEETMTDREK